MDKLSLEKHEKWSLYGSFLVMISTFLPWYIAQYPNVELPWNGAEFSGNVYGYLLFVGRVILLLAGINMIAILYSRRKGETTETYLLKFFLVAILTFVFVFNVLPVIFLSPGRMYFHPHFGLLALLFGVVMTVIGLKKNYSSVEKLP